MTAPQPADQQDPRVEVADGWLPYVPLAWHRVARYERDPQGEIVRDERTRQARFLGLTDRWRAHPIGWTDRDADGRVWCLS